ncbi:MAG: tRNA (adenosine(37)-N6)-threonylcarbamoyltransferase complex dimerization subunit type 1 TsaB [Phycisphaerae bacterium]|nr:tRNA (adenosine(37)-N6)-threonylcarbamoyltransferase complex dimerization subunit type 1 TsaB [Phycisphaerae bacterium]
MKENLIYDRELVLAIETSGRVGSVAVGRGDTLLAESVFSGFMKQGAELFPQIRNMLMQVQASPSEIRQVIIAVGPGSFTGLRIAVTVAKMMYFTHQVKIVAVDSTDVLAENAPIFMDNDTEKPVDCVCTILDAKRNLFYASVFERGSDGWLKIFGTQLVTSEEILAWLAGQGKKAVYFLGEGLVYYAEKFEAPFAVMLDKQYWAPRAGGLFRVGQKLAARGKFTNPHALTPLYIRKTEAEENWEKRQSNG